METEQIAKILDLHSIPHYIKGGRIYADTMCAGVALFEDVEDLTDYTSSQLYAWLGY